MPDRQYEYRVYRTAPYQAPARRSSRSRRYSRSPSPQLTRPRRGRAPSDPDLIHSQHSQHTANTVTTAAVAVGIVAAIGGLVHALKGKNRSKSVAAGGDRDRGREDSDAEEEDREREARRAARRERRRREAEEDEAEEEQWRRDRAAAEEEADHRARRHRYDDMQGRLQASRMDGAEQAHGQRLLEYVPQGRGLPLQAGQQTYGSPPQQPMMVPQRERVQGAGWGKYA